jgi:hypothetical protein
VNAESGTMSKPAVGLPAVSNVDHLYGKVMMDAFLP